MLRHPAAEKVVEWFKKQKEILIADIAMGFIIALVFGLVFHTWHIAIGLVFTLVLGCFVGPILDLVKVGIKGLPEPEICDTSIKTKWEQLDDEPEGYRNPGHVLGVLERLLFFFAIWSSNLEIIAGWLTFKVASKWEVYSNMIFLPQKLDRIEDIDYLLLRRRRGSQRLMTFLIGNIANVLVALVGVLIGRYIHVI